MTCLRTRSTVFCRSILLFYFVLVTIQREVKADSGAIRPVVVIVSLDSCCPAESWPEAEEKIRQEFIQSGIEVVTVNGVALQDGERRGELIRVAEEYQAAAAIRIVKPLSGASQAGVDLWITDRVTQKTVYRYLPLDDVGSGESSIVAGLKTMELFKGSLQEIHLDAQSPKTLPNQIQSISESPRYPQNSRKPFRLGGGFSGIFFARDVGVRGAPLAMLGWTPTEGLLLQVEGWFGIMGRDVKSDGNASSLFVNCAVLKTMWEMNRTRIVRPALGLALGAAFISVEGKSPDVEREQSDHHTSVVLGISTQIGFSITESFWLTPTFDMGVILPRIAIMFDPDEVALFGVPVLKGGLLIDVHF